MLFILSVHVNCDYSRCFLFLWSMSCSYSDRKYELTTVVGKIIIQITLENLVINVHKSQREPGDSGAFNNSVTKR